MDLICTPERCPTPAYFIFCPQFIKDTAILTTVGLSSLRLYFEVNKDVSLQPVSDPPSGTDDFPGGAQLWFISKTLGLWLF